METIKNPALSQEPRYEPAIVIPLKQEPSLLDWLQSNNRLIPRENADPDSFNTSPDDMEELLDNEDYDEDTYDED